MKTKRRGVPGVFLLKTVHRQRATGSAVEVVGSKTTPKNSNFQSLRAVLYSFFSVFTVKIATSDRKRGSEYLNFTLR
jgi:hypothetical protein